MFSSLFSVFTTVQPPLSHDYIENAFLLSRISLLQLDLKTLDEFLFRGKSSALSSAELRLAHLAPPFAHGDWFLFF